MADSDLHIYIMWANDSGQGFLASAGACMQKDFTGRPIFGRVKYNFGQMTSVDVNSNMDFENMLETTLHELVHVLGFSNFLYYTWVDENGSFYSSPTIQ